MRHCQPGNAALVWPPSLIAAMKIPTLNRPFRGFTLVELLVVIAIIAVLAAMGFAGAQAALNRAKKMKARKICVTMDQAVLGFYDDYGHMPGLGDANADRELVTDIDAGIQLVTILLGYEKDSDEMENPKKVRFFEAPEGKSKRDGIQYGAGSGNTVEGLFDPWGEPYRVLLDGDYNEQLKNPFTGTGNSAILRGKRVVTYTYGKNATNDNGSGDDVASWK